MSFYGTKFIFNGVPSDAYDLMLYDIGNNSAGAAKFASSPTIIEEKIPHRYKPLFYGTNNEDKLQFELVFGLNECRIDEGRPLDRTEMDDIASWLTGHDTYKWLEIEQDDMIGVRYLCMITGLEEIEFDHLQWAMKADVTCDGPYAYRYPIEYKYTLNGDKSVVIYNESSHNGYYYPKIEYSTQTGAELVIENETDNGRTFHLSAFPASAQKVNIDNENCVITNSADINLYDHFNYKFLRLVRGPNVLNMTGHGEIKFTCEFPINIGG